jgi:hypothetical protein
MEDRIFKNLLHNADNFEIISTGQEITKGYKPDIVLQNGDDYIIMECDTNTTRKGYIGGMVKAAKYLSGKKKGIAIFVIKEKKNTTVNQIYAHLTPYFEWIEPLTNLRAVYIISTDTYCALNTPLKILDTVFMTEAKAIRRIKP